MTSLGVILYLTKEVLSLDDKEIAKTDAKHLYCSSIWLTYALLCAIFKDIAIQIFTCCTSSNNICERSIDFHFLGWCFTMPFLVAFTFWSIIGLMSHSECNELPAKDPLHYLYQLTLQLLFFAVIYQYIHFFPVACLYFDYKR